MSTLLEECKVAAHAIVLVDATYSMMEPFGDVGKRWDKALEICQQLPYTNLHILFWNTADHLPLFPKGVHVIPQPINHGVLKHIFNRIGKSLDPQCVTCTDVAFAGIPKDWRNIANTDVILITDGVMGWKNICSHAKQQLKTRLAQAIRQLPKHFRLLILTIESNVEATQGETCNFNGSDVYRVIMEEQLTHRVQRFTSYLLDGRTVTHMSRAFVDAGYVPFGHQQFSHLRISEFFHQLHRTAGNTEEEQLATIQKLAGTLAHLLKNQESLVVNSMIDHVVPIFSHLDAGLVRYLLHMGLHNEQKGTVALIQDYRARMKTLYKNAQQELYKNVKVATGIQTQVLSFPVRQHVVQCPAQLVMETFQGQNARFPYGCIQGGVPVMPLLATHKIPVMQAQCIRQYSRSVLATLYGGDSRGDIMLYLCLALNYVITNQPSVPDHVALSYRAWAKIMWHKKRLRSNVTEISFLEDGNIPIPNNATIDKFYNFVREAAAKVGLTGSVMRLWEQWMYALDFHIGRVQQPLCVAHELYGTIPLPAVPVWSVICLNDDLLALDYTCFITMDNLTTKGGYRIPEHKGFSGTCAPRFLVSNEGKAQLQARGLSFKCPLCYSPIQVADLLQVPPRPHFDLGLNLQSAVGNARSVAPQTFHAKNGSVLYILKGTVGAGKSTYAQHLATLASEQKIPSLILNTDQYARTGKPMSHAVEQVRQDLQEFLHKHANEPMIVICDTCNEQYSKRQPVFGQHLPGFRRRILMPNVDQKNLNGYAKWSLHNVLSRPSVHAQSNSSSYWLNPVDTSPNTCREVHRKKFKALWHKRYYNIPANATQASLRIAAEIYQKDLKPLPITLP